MKVRFFVAGSSALLAVWLTATFMNDVPVERYPQFGKGSKPLAAKTVKPLEKENPMVAIDSDKDSGASFE